MAKKLDRQPVVMNWLRIIIASATPEKCVLWTGYCDRDGYGQVCWHINGRQSQLRVHRVILSLVSEPDPSKPLALHSCHNPTCCNPHHLRWGTHADNNREREQAGRGRRSRVSRENIEQLKQLSGSELKLFAKEIGISLSYAYALSRGYEYEYKSFTPPLND